MTAHFSKLVNTKVVIIVSSFHLFSFPFFQSQFTDDYLDDIHKGKIPQIEI